MAPSSFKKLRQSLRILLVAGACILATDLYHKWKQLQKETTLAEKIREICQLPPFPEDLATGNASIMPSSDPNFINVTLTIIGDKKTTRTWLAQVDQWEKNRPGIILNHTLHESENTFRADFAAEVFLSP